MRGRPPTTARRVEAGIEAAPLYVVTSIFFDVRLTNKCGCDLGGVESGEGNHELAVQHFLISSSFGFKESVDAVKMMFKNGQASKDQFAKALKVTRRPFR
ncbi:hypothetical protein THAOC_20111 [Thalassiosira oceanica]|uniref:Uncharacterized protein n=1 Tax=Thalassiosira oceanica TaxID=159749 RepID=K0S480_THAOC|nr:hypothetical protein THAOC_20111 [Thalassiosira oceanica]|eukprot:EJK59634.1 hypothetical protein THAOC_20111 [Thalassiosira oceanica]